MNISQRTLSQSNNIFYQREPAPTYKMERLHLRFIKEKSMVVIRGRSTGVELVSLYANLITEVRDHLELYPQIICYFEYSVINATTTKMLFNFFGKLQKAANKGKRIRVFWLVEEENEDLVAIGHEIRNEFDLDFQITPR